MKKWIGAALGLACLTSAAVVMAATGGKSSVVASLQPAVDDYQFVNAGVTPPTQAACAAANASSGGRRCFAPPAIYSAYDLQPLYDQHLNGSGQTIAII